MQDTLSPHADATDLIAAYRAGHADPVAVMQAHLDRIALWQPVVNALSAQSATVLDEAHAARNRWTDGAPSGPLDGVPVVIKDNLVSAGLPASLGNAALARRVAARDEWPVATLRRAGAIVIGKGNVPEFAVEGFTGNATFGTTGNPYAPALTPGGSSGGVVAAVAAGMAVAGLGTDGGGSIRRPAGYTGLWGLKPGIGAVRRGGGLPQLLLDFETVGPLTRSARDLALIYRVLVGRSETLVPRPLNILAVAQIDDAPCDPAIREAYAATVERLRSLGHTVDEGALPVDLGPLNTIWPSISEYGLAHLTLQDPQVMAEAGPNYREMAARGANRSAADLYEALMQTYALRNATQGLWGYDAVLMPACAAMPWPRAEAFPDRIDGRAVGPRGHAVYTGWVNAAGLPGLAIPAGQAGGLPIGMQLIGPAGSEGMLLTAAQGLSCPFVPPPDLT